MTTGLPEPAMQGHYAAAPMRFHAVPPPGCWWNDPNALCHDGSVYRLFAQQRDDAPQFEATGWGSATSPDLLHWTAHGMAIAPDTGGDAYSGSIAIADDAQWTCWHTVNGRDGQFQVARLSSDGGTSWGPPVEQFGPPRRDWRDPFLFDVPALGGAHMLIAAPTSWSDGADRTSTLELYRRDSAGGWQLVQQIGPWSPPGILWEVPLLLPDPAGDGLWSLIVSLLDRRGGATRCAVRRWRGWLGPDGFTRRDQSDNEGEPVDIGPDFYAAMANTPGGWRGSDRVILGWASSWATARDFRWPGFAGGPISLPRRLTARGSAPMMSTLAAFSERADRVPLAGMATASLMGGGALDIASDDAGLSVGITPHRLSAQRLGADALDWANSVARDVRGPTQLTLFVDGPLIEIYIAPDDLWMTVALPTAGEAFEITLCDAAGVIIALDWRTLSAR